MKATINNVKITIDNVEHEFVEATYNGMAIIKETGTNFINASYFCGQFNKRFRKLFENHSWQEYIDEFENEYYSDSDKSTRPEKGMWSKPWLYKLNSGIPDSLKRLRGTYIDPRLINYVALWINPRYAIQVSKIMDTINDNVHIQLEKQQLADTPEHAEPIFKSVVQTYCQPSLEQQNQQCYFVREHGDRFDYLSSWDKDSIKTLWANFKHSLHSKFDMTLDELARDYPQLLN